MIQSDTHHTLPKAERLSHQKRIDRLFAKGESFIAYPIRVVFCRREEADDDTPVSILVSVSKRKFKRAVKRNRVKRLTREAYRLHKALFFELVGETGQPLDIAFLFLKDQLPDYPEIQKAIIKSASILREKLLQSDPNETNP